MRFLMGFTVTLVLLTIALLSGRSADKSAPETPAGAPTGPVLVELFTSEGCSSCPPADALLVRLDQEMKVAGADVIVLSEHVDYWNHIGWTDPFSSSQFSERQRTYAEALDSDVYTPHMVVDGQEDFVGSDERRARAAIGRASRRPKAQVEVRNLGPSANGKFRLALRVTELPASAKGNLLLAITEKNLSVAVPRGENSGRRLSHTAVVRRLDRVANLDGKRDFTTEIDFAVPGAWKAKDLRAVAFVQEDGSQRVLGAGQVELH
jgi:hypothetical protein